jgi:hypothetical protein
MRALGICNKLLPLAAMVALAAFALPVRAAVLEDFNFSETNGTTLDSVDNTGTAAHSIVLGGASWSPSVTNDGSFRVDNTATNLATAYIDIDNITSGKVWLVAEMAGWNYTSTPTLTDAVLRFAFLDNDGTSGSTITAQMQINRLVTGELQLAGTALPSSGTGAATNIGNVYQLPLMQTEPFTMVLELDKGADEYSLFYKDGNNPYVPAGTGNLGVSTLNSGDRDGNSIRFGTTGGVGDPGEFFDIDRLYLTDVSPVPPVDKLLLEVNTTNGLVTLKNNTSTSFDINWYRIKSSDDSLEFDNWVSLSDQTYDAIDGDIDGDAIVGNGIGETWDEAGGSDDGVLSESFLLGSSVFDMNDSVDLGHIFKYLTGDVNSLVFQYRDSVTGSVFTGNIETVTTTALRGDYNGNGIIDAADYTVWRDALEGDGVLTNDDDGMADEGDFVYWRAHFGEMSGAGAGSASSGAAVPEPGSLLLALCGGLMACVIGVRSRRQRG